MVGVGSGGSLTTSHCARINETTAAVRSELSKEGVAGVVGDGALIRRELNVALTRTWGQKWSESVFKGDEL